MDTRDLAIFKSVFENKSFSKAAEEVFLTPQGVSKKIQKLEEELATSLFERSNKGLNPTEKGIQLYFKANEVISLLDDIASMNNQEEKKVLKISFSYGVLSYLNLQLIEQFEKMNPNIRIQYHEETDSIIMSKLRENKIDFAIMGTPVNVENYINIPYFSCPHVAIINKNHSLATREKISYKDLNEETIILVSREFNAYHNNINRFKKAGVSAKFVETGEIRNVLLGAERGNGIGISVDFVELAELHYETVVRPFDDQNMKWEVSFVLNTKARRTEEMENFIKFAQDFEKKIPRHS